MELEITPEPTPEELEAIERVLTALRAERQESPWWRTGLDEALRDPTPANGP